MFYSPQPWLIQTLIMSSRLAFELKLFDPVTQVPRVDMEMVLLLVTIFL